MSINPDTLKQLRKERNLSQQALAERCEQINSSRVSKRTIARIETGETPPDRVRAHTVESLARALDVTSEALGKPSSEVSDEDWKKSGYTPIRVLLPDAARQNYRWVLHHYEIQFHDLVEAAPWMFTLLAEMSLAERRQRLAAAGEAFETAMSQLPGHLRHGNNARSDFENACIDEERSLASRDIFGNEILASAEGSLVCDPFDPNEGNPFVGFLTELAEKVDRAAIDSEHIELPYGGGVPRWPVFENWLSDLTGGDYWAGFAMKNVRVGIADMPEDLKAVEKTPERVAWLIDKIPPEVREKEEMSKAERRAKFSEIKI
ncbi:MAG: helix-turn-helix transcriptional regulator [Marivita sp.]|jgi:transcriptional regulator with XRE-family HTH domain|uniref:helix-turn-helix domain-containing protein n=1 Tax=Marivita sp. TaxID=2003365 RepID=UPI001B1DBC28|nr:helix-turn-helix transcriptional regulator [Marivita sp.]MBO6882642.1 helix-turn-helix transcriptional regulator [Marivita sp.]